jgi:hypothetical protein
MHAVATDRKFKYQFGVWLSLVERLVRDQEVASTNLVTPTRYKFKPNRDLDYLPVLPNI